MRRAQDELSTLTSSGTLRVSVPVPLGRIFGGRLIARFRQVLPQVRLELSLHNRHVDLVRDRFDLAIRGGTVEEADLVVRMIGTIPMSLYASPSYQRSAVGDLPIIAIPSDEPVLQNAELALQAPVVIVDDRSAVLDALLDGAGAGLLPAFLGEAPQQRGDLVRIFETPVHHRKINAVFLPAQREDARIRLLIDALITVLRDANQTSN